MPEEFLWDINWEELPDEASSQPAVPAKAPPAKAPAVAPAAPSSPPPTRQAPIATPATAAAAPLAPTPPPVHPQPSAPSMPTGAAAGGVEAKALVRGQRIDLATLGRGELVFEIAVKLTASGASLCCLGLMENDRFVADEYFVFDNQPASPCGSCRLVASGKQIELHLDLTRAPKQLHRLLLATYTDAQRGLGAHGAGTLEIRHGVGAVGEGSIATSDLGSGPCALIAEIYRRNNGWRLGVLLVGSGGSLEALLRSHGADVQ